MNRNRENILNNIFETNPIAIIPVMPNNIQSSLSISQCNAGRLLSNREIRQMQKRTLFAKS